jgi:hypothetical protein
MDDVAASALRAELVAVLAANTARLCDGLRTELARSVKLEAGRRLQLEVDPWSWGVSSCASEEPVITDDWLSRALTWEWFERVETAGANSDVMISDELCPWFARCWHEVEGPARFSPAFLFFHDYHDQQFDLEQSRWVPTEEAFGE